MCHMNARAIPKLIAESTALQCLPGHQQRTRDKEQEEFGCESLGTCLHGLGALPPVRALADRGCRSLTMDVAQLGAPGARTSAAHDRIGDTARHRTTMPEHDTVQQVFPRKYHLAMQSSQPATASKALASEVRLFHSTAAKMYNLACTSLRQ